MNKSRKEGTRRASPLNPKRQRQVAIFYDKNKLSGWSAEDVATEFNCRPQQVYYAYKRYKSGTLGNPPKKHRKVEEILSKEDSDTILSKQLHIALSELHADTQLTAEQRTNTLKDLIVIRKTLQQIELQNHLRRTDAEFLAWLIRKHIMPDATNDEIVKFYREAMQQYSVEEGK